MSARDGDDDRHWAEALAGRPAEGSDPATAAEARLLRDALRRWPAAAPEPRLDEAALLAAARSRGLLPARRPTCGPCAALRRWLGQPMAWGGLALAGVLGLAVLPGLLAPPEAEGPVLRSPAGVVQRTATDPAAARDALAARLRAGGADVRTYDRAGAFGLDAEWAAGPAPVLADALAAEGLVRGPDGSLRVEFRRPGE